MQLGYRYGWSFQDNRQEGRETSDLRNRVHGINAGLSPAQTIGLQVELSLERADNLETGRTDETRRLGASVTWQPLKDTSLLVNASTTLGWDEVRTSETDGEELAAELSLPLRASVKTAASWGEMH